MQCHFGYLDGYAMSLWLFRWLRNEKEEHFETKKQRLKELDEASTHSRRNRKERKMATEVVSSQLTKKVSPKRFVFNDTVTVQ